MNFITGDLVADIIILILTALFGGGLFSGYQAFQQANKTKQEAASVGLKTPVEIESIRIASLDLVLKNLQEENALVRVDRDYWKNAYTQVKGEIDNLINEMDEYRRRIAELQTALERAAAAAPSADRDL